MRTGCEHNSSVSRYVLFITIFVSLYQVRSSPPTSSVINFSKKSTRRLLLDRHPGTEYIIYVVTRVPRLNGVTSSISFVSRKNVLNIVHTAQDIAQQTIFWFLDIGLVFHSYCIIKCDVCATFKTGFVVKHKQGLLWNNSSASLLT